MMRATRDRMYKLTGSGNDFVFADGRETSVEEWPAERIRAVCARRTGVGADGLVILGPRARVGEGVRFRYFNSDGSLAAMCGNGALCATRLAVRLDLAPGDDVLLETDSGQVRGRCLPGPGERAELRLADVTRIDAPPIARIGGEREIYLARVGVPHLVVVVDDVDAPAADPMVRGPQLRWDAAVGGEGANVNFVAHSPDGWRIRTYERGVEAETLACGTGAVAAAAALAMAGVCDVPVRLRTVLGCLMEVGGDTRAGLALAGPTLAGEGRLVFEGYLQS